MGIPVCRGLEIPILEREDLQDLPQVRGIGPMAGGRENLKSHKA
jgi:hypothetical protein